MCAIILLFLLITIPSILCGIISLRLRKKEIEKLNEAKINLEENALIKARAVAEFSGDIVMADDSGLEIDYLDKAPGVLSARFMGHDTSYDVKNNALLEKLDGVPFEERTARFVCAIAAVLPDGTEYVVRGTMEGYIGDKIAGENGFGYDPIFFLKEYGCTSAEISEEEKNAISHRGNALRLMRKKLSEEGKL